MIDKAKAKLVKLGDYQLNFVAFLNGAIILIIELVAVRIIAPYFGSSFFVWTSIIGVILASLSFGYWQGGKLADQGASRQNLAKILFFGGILILCSILFGNIILGISSSLRLDVRWASLLASAILFAPANVVLGMVSPYVAKLEVHQLKETGRKVGNIYAAGTLGSLVGVFLAGYILIGLIGSSRLMLVTAILVIVTSFIASAKTWLVARIVAIVLCLALLAVGQVGLLNPKVVLADIDTNYSRYLVTNLDYKGKQVRALQTNWAAGQSAVDPQNPQDLVFDYTKAFDYYQAFVPQPTNALAIGGAANIYPGFFTRENAQNQIDVVEIDPQLTDIAKKYFYYTPGQQLSIFNEDGRTYLNRTNSKYGVVFMDAFNNSTIPFQLTSRETVQKLYDHTDENGVVLTNIVSPVEPGKRMFLEAVVATYQSVFPLVHVYQIPEHSTPGQLVNVMLVASKRPAQAIAPTNEVVERMLKQEVSIGNNPQLVLTDDFAPVEQYLNQ